MIDCYYHCPGRPAPATTIRPEEGRKKVAILGSKGLPLKGWRWFYKMCDRATFPLEDPIILACGWSDKTVDLYAVNWASHNWYTLRIYYPDESKWKPAQAKKKRINQILADADYVAVFYNGRCQETQSLITYAKEMGIKVKVFKFKEGS